MVTAAVLGAFESIGWGWRVVILTSSSEDSDLTGVVQIWSQEAIDYLFGDGNQVPRLVLLDLGLPDTRGFEVLRRVRENERTRVIPVVVLTSSISPDDVAESYRLGANSYVRKLVDFDRFSDRIREVGSYWLGINEPLSDGLATWPFRLR